VIKQRIIGGEQECYTGGGLAFVMEN